jgi:hypothetical protein
MHGDIYRCTDGRWYGDAQLWARFERGVWTPCCWDTESGTEWVETTTGDLLELRPVLQTALPADVTVAPTDAGLWIDRPATVPK